MPQKFNTKRLLVVLGTVLLFGAAVAWYAGLIPTPSSRPPRNSLLVIAPYRYNGTWVFDDPRFGLVREPAEESGNYYKLDDPPMEGWLCPALFKYYDEPPPEFYIKADPIAAK